MNCVGAIRLFCRVAKGDIVFDPGLTRVSVADGCVQNVGRVLFLPDWQLDGLESGQQLPMRDNLGKAGNYQGVLASSILGGRRGRTNISVDEQLYAKQGD